MKKALITGVTGQDGSYLSEFLLEKGYEVHGTIRRSSVDYRERIAHLEGTPNFHLHYADMSDSMSLVKLVGMEHCAAKDVEFLCALTVEHIPLLVHQVVAFNKQSEVVEQLIACTHF